MRKLLLLGLTVALVLAAMPVLVAAPVLANGTPPDTIYFYVDAKPNSCPSSINLKSKGLVPVAVYTRPDIDAATIDPETVLFAGAEPVRWRLEDVDYDGALDLLLHFKTQELDLTAGSTVAHLTGTTYDGQPLMGTGPVNIVPKGK